MDALRGFALLLLCQSAGEALAHGANLPLPGPVLGMLMALLLLSWPALRPLMAAVAEPLIGHLSLLFVPVGVGVVTHLALVSQHGFRIVVVLLVSTVVGLAVTALLLQTLLRGTPAAEVLK